jgi:hypothetical protein
MKYDLRLVKCRKKWHFEILKNAKDFASGVAYYSFQGPPLIQAHYAGYETKQAAVTAANECLQHWCTTCDMPKVLTVQDRKDRQDKSPDWLCIICNTSGDTQRNGI